MGTPSYGGVLDSQGNERNVGDTISSNGHVKVAIVEGDAGALELSQLPVALTAGGNLKVAIVEGGGTGGGSSGPSDQLPAELSADGNLKVDVQKGSVAVTNFPATQEVSGSVGVTGTVSTTSTQLPVTLSGTGNLKVDVQNTSTPQTVSGSVSVSNFPATQEVSGSVGVNGTVATSAIQLPAALTAGGNLKVAIVEGGGTGGGSSGPSTQLPAELTADGNFKVDVQKGSIAVTNFPATQPISGTVGVTGTVSTTSTQLPVALSGTGNLKVDVQNTSTPQTVSGSVSVSNLPAVQPVSDNNASLTVDSPQFPTALSATGNLKVDVQNFNVQQPVQVTNIISTTSTQLPSALSASGNLKVDIQNPTATQTVTGSVSVSNFPATQAVSGTVALSSLPVNNQLPAALNSTGNLKVDVLNEPIVMVKSGTISNLMYVKQLPTDLTALGNLKVAVAEGTLTASTGEVFADTYKYSEYLGLATGGAYNVWVPAAGKRIRLMGVTLHASAISAIYLVYGTGFASAGTKTLVFRSPTGGTNAGFYFGQGMLLPVDAKVMIYNSPSAPASATTDSHCLVWGREE